MLAEEPVREQYGGEEWRGGWCWRHGQPRDPTLGYCWRCLAEERDPPALAFGSVWWRNRGWDFCRCSRPDVVGRRCQHCGKRDGPALP